MRPGWETGVSRVTRAGITRGRRHNSEMYIDITPKKLQQVRLG